MRFFAMFGIIAATALLLYSTTGLPALFDPASPASTHVSPLYIERSYVDMGTRNFVTAILANYRAYDTLGEVVVVFTAGLAAVFVLKPLGSFVNLSSKRRQRHVVAGREVESEN